MRIALLAVVLLTATAAAANEAAVPMHDVPGGGATTERVQEGWKIFERARRLASGSANAPGSSESIRDREALVSDLERWGWATRVFVPASAAGSDGGPEAAVVAEKGVPGGELFVLSARLPYGSGREGALRAWGGAAVLVDVASRLGSRTPRHAWRLVLFEGRSRGSVVAARREAVRSRGDRIGAFVSVERVGRPLLPLVAIPFPDPDGAPGRASVRGCWEHLSGAGRSEGVQLFLGDPGREMVFSVASRLFGVEPGSLAIEFAKEGHPSLLLTDAAPSELDRREERRGELDPESLASTSALLSAFLLRIDLAPPLPAEDRFVVWFDRKVDREAARNLLLVLTLLASVRVLSYRRGRTSPAVETVQLSAAALFAVGAAGFAIERPIPAVVLLGPLLVVAALLPPGRLLTWLAEIMVAAAPLAWIVFYFEVEAGGSGVFPARSGLALLRDPGLAALVAGLTGATVAAFFLRRPKRSSPA
jgi:hypothetical protein